MNKNLYKIAVLLCFGLFAFATSCSDDDNEYVVDEAWKAYQEQVFANAGKTEGFSPFSSESGNDKVYSKELTDFIKDTEFDDFDRTMRPYFTDSVYIRYEGWYYNQNGDSIRFDGTEGPNGNGRVLKSVTKGFVDGFTTILQYMAEGDQRRVCIPSTLGYGPYDYGNIKGYTTLWFDIKLMKVKRVVK